MDNIVAAAQVLRGRGIADQNRIPLPGHAAREVEPRRTSPGNQHIDLSFHNQPPLPRVCVFPGSRNAIGTACLEEEFTTKSTKSKKGKEKKRRRRGEKRTKSNFLNFFNFLNLFDFLDFAVKKSSE
jgi:hypothetical protein